MGCVSSNLLSQEDEIGRLGSSALSQHIVSLTSTTYGLLNLDPVKPSPTQTQAHLHSPTTPPIPPSRFTLSEPRPIRSDPDVINSWELLDGLDSADSFRFPLLPKPKPFPKSKFDPNPNSNPDKENSSPNFGADPDGSSATIDRFEVLCPPGGEGRVVIYTTSLRGVRSTFEACNAVRAAVEGLGVSICERDVSMDRGFREELRELMNGKERESNVVLLPQVFVKGRYVGGAEEVLRMAEEGQLGDLLCGLPRRRGGSGCCEGCGGVRFLPCFHCNGSCKVVEDGKSGGAVVKCPECNENGLVLCPICS